MLRTEIGVSATSSRARPSRFDVVCAGEASWDFMTAGFRPGGGAINAAVSLARGGMRVGLAAVVGDDHLGRGLLARLEAVGVDVGGVALAPLGPGILVVEPAGEGRRVLRHRPESEPAAEVPSVWAASVLLISGLSPALAYTAELCRAARAARRAGTIVVVDVNARRHAWAGHDARTVRALVGEADVVRYSGADLAGLGVGAEVLCTAARRGAVIVATDGAGPARATGPFGELVSVPRRVLPVKRPGAGDAFTAAICGELARAGDVGNDRADLWDRALRRGHAAAEARLLSRPA